ncbi:MAG: tRNA pseudouridine(38-40) synthase TruA [Acidobacteria bacterium]|nr:MAG: tRNA pseudouridine(38-40) synthase TruA [Acidobacteriota bacterium]
MVYRLILAYRGTRYAGWQRQANALAVQEVVETALADLLGTAPTLHAAGRTDAGVHARGQVAHFVPPRPFPLRGLVHGGNHRLPDDVRILSAARMAEGFHARKSALGKVYLYRLHRGPVVSPLDADQLAAAPRRLDLEAMRRALRYLPGRHDFSAFALAGGSHRQARRRIYAATLDPAGRELRLRIAGDGFLRGMVRSLAGTLIEVGAGRRPPSSFRELLGGAPRAAAGPTAPACGLVLEQVFYGPRWQPLERCEP